ncbi:MAG: zinc ABC transporter substrate-binding protein [Campylobacterales bacterium]|nr:zinc ABC transporter substrate-binding protein [Campylobacterales bacterium]
MRLFLIFFVTLSLGYAKVNAVVSILPQVNFVKAVGGDKVDVALMVEPGNSPHSYEPKPSQMRNISKAQLYFTIGVEFEKVWLERFKSQNSAMRVVDTTQNITKAAMEEANEHEHHGHHEHKHQGYDPHIWTSPANVKIIAQNIYEGLAAIDKANQAYYKANLDKFLAQIESVDQKIKNILKDTPKGAKFMVFHPAWGYFAAQYHLTQMPIEVEGKEPKPKTVAKLIAKAKKEQIRAIFTAPEFSDSVANTIANELGIAVIKVSPLNPKWGENLINLAKAIAQ